MSAQISRYEVDAIHMPQGAQLEALNELLLVSSFTTQGTIVDGLGDRVDSVLAVRSTETDRYIAAAHVGVIGHIASVGALFGSTENISIAVHPLVMKLAGRRKADFHVKVVLADITAAQPGVVVALEAEGFTHSQNSSRRMVLTNTERLLHVS